MNMLKEEIRSRIGKAQREIIKMAITNPDDRQLQDLRSQAFKIVRKYHLKKTTKAELIEMSAKLKAAIAAAM